MKIPNHLILLLLLTIALSCQPSNDTPITQQLSQPQLARLLIVDSNFQEADQIIRLNAAQIQSNFHKIETETELNLWKSIHGNYDSYSQAFEFGTIEEILFLERFDGIGNRQSPSQFLTKVTNSLEGYQYENSSLVSAILEASTFSDIQSHTENKDCFEYANDAYLFAYYSAYFPAYFSNGRDAATADRIAQSSGLSTWNEDIEYCDTISGFSD